ncbi:MAG: hypothetical protein PHR30_02590 [Gallionellaceae bacterium]|nr:hypothetical protein [Gallionellaceae bacterium]
MNKLTVALTALLAGGAAGYFAATLSSGAPERTRLERDFQVRVEEYQPTCAQLSKEGLNGPVRAGSDYLFVRVQPDYFYVIGLRAEPGQPPITAWWGAARQSARAQACAKP